MIPSAYIRLYLAMEKEAYRHGWALLLSGSINRDLDVVAIPWTEECSTEAVLVADLIRKFHFAEGSDRYPVDKPWGRKAYTFLLDHPAYVDLSVMPRRE